MIGQRRGDVSRIADDHDRAVGAAPTGEQGLAPPGRVVLADADLVGDVAPLTTEGDDLAVAAFAERRGGGFGIAKRAGRALIRARSGYDCREPLSGQRALRRPCS